VAEFALFTVLIEDVNKAFWTKELKTEAELCNKISKEFYNLLLLFMKKEVDKLNLYKPGIDYKINLKKDDYGREVSISFRPLYNML
jgi:hypothetical protein